MPQQILTMTTTDVSVRSEVLGWTAHDPRRVYDNPSAHQFRQDRIGLVGDWSGPYPSYQAVLYALADGWAILAPPTKLEDGTWEWWLTRNA